MGQVDMMRRGGVYIVNGGGRILAERSVIVEKNGSFLPI